MLSSAYTLRFYGLLDVQRHTRAEKRIVEGTRILQEHYVDPAKIEDSLMTAAALEGMARKLDKFTTYLSADELRAKEDKLNGITRSPGVITTAQDNRAIVVATLPGSAAEKAGIKAGDEVVALNNTKPFEPVPKEDFPIWNGPVMQMEVKPKDETGTKTYRLQNEAHKNGSVVDARRITAPDGRQIGYFRVTDFTESTDEDAKPIVTQLIEQKVSGMVIDLRDNPGGYEETARKLCGFFLPSGTLVATRFQRAPAVPQEIRTSGMPVVPQDVAVAIMVNQSTASSAEMFAAAMRDAGRGFVVGTKTRGKGSGQEFFTLEDGSALLVTVSEFRRPNREKVADAGVLPDTVIEAVADQESARQERKWYATLADADRQRLDQTPDSVLEQAVRLTSDHH